ncbi:MAG: hypothetical protein HOO06_05105 [Bdellovibrionaceae bacterium]|jgi:hypothetical protein|nr:hypothetical protein [Pseudobdellovibrionaceae bacterium]
MEATIQSDFNDIFSSLTKKEKSKNKRLKKQSKKLKNLVERFSSILNKSLEEVKRSKNG